jgi:two-component system, response regulator PdtaR
MTLTLPTPTDIKPPFNVLIADDDKGNRETLRDLLEARGFKTTLAADGGEAVEIAQVQRIHVCVFDLHMPRLTGLEAVQLVRQIHELLPAILMTADATREVMRQAHEARVYSVIPKPVNLNVIMHTLAGALARVYGSPPNQPTPPTPQPPTGEPQR